MLKYICYSKNKSQNYFEDCNNYTENLRVVDSLSGAHGCVNSVDWDLEGTKLLTTDDNSHVRIHQYFLDDNHDGDGQIIYDQEMNCLDAWAAKFCFHSNDKIIAGSECGKLFFLDVNRGTIPSTTIKPIYKCMYSVTNIVVSPHDPNEFSVFTNGKTFRIFDIRCSYYEPAVKIEFPASLGSGDYHPIDSHKIAAGSRDGSVRVLDRRFLLNDSDLHHKQIIQICRPKKFEEEMRSQNEILSYKYHANSVKYEPKLGRYLLVNYMCSDIYLFDTREYESDGNTISKLNKNTSNYQPLTQPVDIQQVLRSFTLNIGSRNTGQRRPAENNGQRQPAENNGQRQPAENTGQRRPAENTEQRQPAENTEQRQRAENIGQRPPAENTEQRQRAENTEQRQRAENTDQRRPAENTENANNSATQAIMNDGSRNTRILRPVENNENVNNNGDLPSNGFINYTMNHFLDHIESLQYESSSTGQAITNNGSRNTGILQPVENNENENINGAQANPSVLSPTFGRLTMSRYLEIYRNDLEQFHMGKIKKINAVIKLENKNVGHCKVIQTFTGSQNFKTLFKDAVFWGNNYILSGSECGHIMVWKRDSSYPVTVIPTDESVVSRLKPHPKIPMLASCGTDHNVKIVAPNFDSLDKDEKKHMIDQVVAKNQEKTLAYVQGPGRITSTMLIVRTLLEHYLPHNSS